MKNDVIFSTRSHTYAYSFKHKEYIPIHPILKCIYSLNNEGKEIEMDEELRKYPQEEVKYYVQKYKFLQQSNFIGEKENLQFGEVTGEIIKREIENLTSLTFEVTERCNLRCKYCAYSELYYGFNERKGENLSFPKAQSVLDYLFDVFKETPQLSSDRTLMIGFYGGEPLMNMKLIKQIVTYAEGHKPPKIKLIYNMTTNAMLLHIYQDYLAEHKVQLLISLDGTEIDDSLRVTVKGKNSFVQVFENIKKMQSAYPIYFEKYVNFNSVIHSESNIERIIYFFNSEFNKKPALSELNNASIAQKEKYKEMKRSIQKSIALSPLRKDIDELLMYNSPDISSVTYFLHHLSNEVFKDYHAMLRNKRYLKMLPTGTCIPFSRKMYVTVHGRILACERIDHEFATGCVTDNAVELDFKSIADAHGKYCSKLLPQCKQCYTQDSCSQCMYYTDISAPKVICRNFKNREMFAEYLAQNIEYLEHNRWVYQRVMKEIFIF